MAITPVADEASAQQIGSAHPEPRSDAAAAALLEELRGLVRLAAHRSDLVVREGNPDGTWAFRFDTGEIIVDPGDLRSLAPDLCRGLALHEAAHAAVTVLPRVVPPARLAPLMPLLNVIEDMRIEIWMRSRFPGAVPWIRAYNDLFYGIARSLPLPQSRQVQFLKGILDLWWYGTACPGTLPEVSDALDACREAIAAAVACQPPLEPDAVGVLASQQAMWEIVRARILPAWAKLAAADRAEGIGPLAAQEIEEFAVRLGGQAGYGLFGRVSRRRMAPRPATTTIRRIPNPRGSSEPGQPARSAAASGQATLRAQLSTATGADGSDAYLAAWKRIAPEADRLGDELLRLLVPRRRLRWQTGHASGPRLDLRRAFEFEADPRRYDRLWSRPLLPQRCDPALVLLIDRSGSMDGESIERSFEGLVLLVEVCRRVGAPAAVWSFANRPQEELAWNAPLDASARRRLGLIPRTCAGNTNMAAALAAVGRAFESRHGDPKLLLVLGDGEPDRPEPTLAAVRDLDQSGITTIGLGLGAGTQGLARFFPCAATEIPPARIVDHVASLLEASLLAGPA